MKYQIEEFKVFNKISRSTNPKNKTKNQNKTVL
jgi:hypothetical protein